MKVVGVLVILIVSFCHVVAQAPIGFNYQGVARNSDGSPQVHQDISIRVNILTGGVSGTVDYSETHTVTTNSFGLFTVIIGQGENSGNLQNVDWTTGDKWLQLEMDMNGGTNYQMVGAQQIFSVPYAMYASQAGSGLLAGEGLGISDGVITNTQPDVPVKLLGAGNVTITGNYPEYIITGGTGNQNLSSVLDNGADAGGKSITGLGSPVNKDDAATKTYVDSKNIDDADADPLNEIQDLEISGNLLSLTLNGTPTVIDLTPYLDNTDNQTLSVSSTSTLRTFDISNGNSVSFDIADNDNDAGNELQTISKTSNTVTLSNGGGSISVDDGDSDNTNELQVLSKTGNQVNLSDGGGSFIDEVNDADADPANEIQTLSNVSNNLILSSGGSVDLSGYLDNTDNQNLNSSASGTNRTINISGGTGTTISVIDNDNEPLNEIQNLTEVLAQGADAGGSNINNLSDPTLLQDAATKNYVDLAEDRASRDYAFKVSITNLISTGGDLTFDLSGFDFDEGGLIGNTEVTVIETGVYAFTVKGNSSEAAPSTLILVIDGVNTIVNVELGSKYQDTFLFKINAGKIVELKATSTAVGETFNIQFFGYKI